MTWVAAVQVSIAPTGSLYSFTTKCTTTKSFGIGIVSTAWSAWLDFLYWEAVGEERCWLLSGHVADNFSSFELRLVRLAPGTQHFKTTKKCSTHELYLSHLSDFASLTVAPGVAVVEWDGFCACPLSFFYLSITYRIVHISGLPYNPGFFHVVTFLSNARF